MSAIRRASDLGTRGTVVIADGSVTSADLASQSFSFPSDITVAGSTTLNGVLSVVSTSTTAIGVGGSGTQARFWSTSGDNFNIRTHTNTPNPNFSLGVMNGSGTDSAVPVYWENGTLTLRGSGTSGTHLRINSSGQVTHPEHVRFRADRSGNLAGYNPDTGGSQANAVVFNNAHYNVGSAYNTSTGRFTAPVAGTYVFQASIYQSAPIQQMWWVVNGSRERTFFNDHNAQSINIAGSGLIYLNQNDTVGVVSWSGGATVTVYDNWYHTYFRGSLVG